MRFLYKIFLFLLLCLAASCQSKTEKAFEEISITKEGKEFLAKAQSGDFELFPNMKILKLKAIYALYVIDSSKADLSNDKMKISEFHKLYSPFFKRSITKTDTPTAIISYSDPGVDRNGNCAVTANYYIKRESGETIAELKNVTICAENDPPAKGYVQLAKRNLRVNIPQSEAAGTFVVEAEITDHKLDGVVTLQRALKVN